MGFLKVNVFIRAHVGHGINIRNLTMSVRRLIALVDHVNRLKLNRLRRCRQNNIHPSLAGNCLHLTWRLLMRTSYLPEHIQLKILRERILSIYRECPSCFAMVIYLPLEKYICYECKQEWDCDGEALGVFDETN